jgi:hypothetical protein
VIQDLPVEMQENIKTHLLSGDFLSAKKLHDEYVDEQQ